MTINARINVNGLMNAYADGIMFAQEELTNQD